jgi:hypothetical protein
MRRNNFPVLVKAMNEATAFALLSASLPLLSFVSAGMLEFQRDRRSLRSLVRVLPLVFAVVVSISLMIDLYYPYFSLRGLSKAMSALSLLVAVSALLCRYKSRVTAALIFIGGLVLAFIWLLNRWVA